MRKGWWGAAVGAASVSVWALLEVRMFILGIVLPLAVFVVFSDCVPVGNTTLHRGYSIPLAAQGLNSNIERYTRSSPVKTKGSATSRISETQFKPIPTAMSPKCAMGSTFCESIDNYPKNYLENVIQNALGEFHELLGTDQLESTDLIKRFGTDNNNETPLCASEETIVFPQTAKNKDEKWLYVVNHDSYVQGVRIEKCKEGSSDSPSSCTFSESFPLGYKTTCKQKYIYRKLVAVDDGGKPVTDNFLLPSCCACTVVSNGLENKFMKNLKKSLRSTTTSSTTAKPK